MIFEGPQTTALQDIELGIRILIQVVLNQLLHSTSKTWKPSFGYSDPSLFTKNKSRKT